MNIHEYQAKELLAKFGVPVPAGVAAMTVEDAVKAVDTLPGPLYVVKAQIAFMSPMALTSPKNSISPCSLIVRPVALRSSPRPKAA